MIRRSIIILCLLSAVLSAFVGYLSHEAIQQASIRGGPLVPTECADLLQSLPTETARFEFKAFIPGKHVASISRVVGDDWDLVCVPMFPSTIEQNSRNYRAVVICFKGVPDRPAFNELISHGQLDLHYWPGRQQLNFQIHSQLSQQYKNLDLVNCPVLHYGFSPENPVLGRMSLQISKIVGATSLVIFAGTLLLGLVFRVFAWGLDLFDSQTDDENPMQNKAGLPESTSVLDQVTRMRDRNPSCH